MNQALDSSRVETLGACLLNLKPGDPCLCCGFPVREVATGRLGRQLVLLPEQAPAATVVLACPECGCEVDGEEEPPEAGRGQLLNPAA